MFQSIKQVMISSYLERLSQVSTSDSTRKIISLSDELKLVELHGKNGFRGVNALNRVCPDFEFDPCSDMPYSEFELMHNKCSLGGDFAFIATNLYSIVFSATTDLIAKFLAIYTIHNPRKTVDYICQEDVFFGAGPGRALVDDCYANIFEECDAYDTLFSGSLNDDYVNLYSLFEKTFAVLGEHIDKMFPNYKEETDLLLELCVALSMDILKKNVIITRMNPERLWSLRAKILPDD